MSDLIHNFGIDWKVLIAQVVNFAILLFILKRFAFGPVMKILNDRRERIAKAIEQAQHVEDRMKEIDSMKEAVLSEARTESRGIIAKAEHSAKVAQENILKETQAKSERLIKDATAKIELDREKLRSEIKSEIAELIADATERTLGDVFDASAQKKMVSGAVSLIKKK